MDEVFKYHRIQGKLSDILKKDRITACVYESNSIILGTEEGFIHVFNLDGSNGISLKPHDRPINCISVDNGKSVIASCSDSGNVVMCYLFQNEYKENVIQFNEPVKSINIDNEFKQKDKSFIIGCASGKLIHHKLVWFSQRNVVLFHGSDSPISVIAWRGNIVAWADSTHVRVLNIAKQTAICSVNCPSGVGLKNIFPCHLIWETDSDLLIGWADSFRHLEFVTNLAGGSSSSGGSTSTQLFDSQEIVARTAAEWHADCIICGICPFDADNVVILGYVPPDEDIASSESKQQQNQNNTSCTNTPELQILKKQTGDTISCDLLALRGQMVLGPFGYYLRSTFASSPSDVKSTVSASASSSANKWQLNDVTSVNRGGSKGHAPSLFIISPQDLVVAKVRDVNDRISMALQQGDVLLAVNLASKDRNSLRHYLYNDLLNLHIENLLEFNEPEKAALECCRLIGDDNALWERWIYAFTKLDFLPYLIDHIPTVSPRLSQAVYELVIETFANRNSKFFLTVVKQWGRIQPQLFNHANLLSKLDSARGLDAWCMEAKAQLHLWAGDFKQALNCYLDISYPEDNNTPTSSQQEDKETYSHVFELIDKKNLYTEARDRVLNLVRMSKPLAASMLLKNMDKFPIPAIVRQLKSDKRLLHWYLHTVFCKYDRYNIDNEFSEYHVMQVSLYAEFAPQAAFFRRRTASSVSTTNNDQDGAYCTVGDDVLSLIESSNRPPAPESDMMTFLRTSKFYPIDLALRECEKRKPPLYIEMVYILDLKGLRREALSLILRESEDTVRAIKFIESHEESQQKELWKDFIDHCLQYQGFLSDLLDCLGICKLDPVEAVNAIPAKMKIPSIRKKILRILKQYQFQVYMTDKCNMILEEDALESLRRLNQGQRRAVKVDPGFRCGVCARPIFMSHGVSRNNNPLNILGSENSSQYGADIQIWGHTGLLTSLGSVVIFSSKQAFHRPCFNKLHTQTILANNGIPHVGGNNNSIGAM